MYSIVEVNNSFNNELGGQVVGATHFICEMEDDIKELPKSDIGIGSRALIIPTGEIYMLGPSREWLKYKGVSIMN